VLEASEMGVRISEIYPSIQCEGPRTGMATVFLRFGGCNLRCPGWPCDTLYAVLPENRAEWTRRSARQALLDVFASCRETGAANVCLTGGEPFIQNNDALEFIVRGLLDRDIAVEAFSNGQVRYPNWAFELVNFIMDWKLPGSGNASDATHDIAAMVIHNIDLLKPTDVVKFVIKDDADLEHAIGVWETLKDRTPAQFWAGIVWEGEMREAELVAEVQAQQLPWNINVQVHKYLWKPEERGV
jgi:7-carboxy-7-deazaguanine synthase